MIVTVLQRGMLEVIYYSCYEFAKYSLVWQRGSNPDITVCRQIMRSAWAPNPHQTGLHSPSRISRLTETLIVLLIISPRHLLWVMMAAGPYFVTVSASLKRLVS